MDVVQASGSSPGDGGVDRAVRWRCHTCGAWMAWNAHSRALECPACGVTVGVLTQPGIPRHAFDGVAAPTPDLRTPASCECLGCGAAVALQPYQISGICPYCRAPFVIEPTLVPDAVIAPLIGRESVQAAFARWVQGLWLASRAFKNAVKIADVNLSFQPVWVFGLNAHVEYAADRGSGQGQAKRWKHVAGAYDASYESVQWTAAPGPGPRWDLSTATVYKPDCLAGAIAFGPSIGLEQAWSAADAAMRLQLQYKATETIGGDVQENVVVTADYSNATWAYILAPTWRGEYHYRKQSFAIDINAETSKVTGAYPRDPIRVAIAVLGILLAVAAVLLFAYVWARGLQPGFR